MADRARSPGSKDQRLACNRHWLSDHRLVWREPTPIRRIRLVCEEHSRARTQEFTLRAFTTDGQREIVRQQFTFSPPGTTVEREEYATNLDAVSRLELVIIPAIDGGDAVTTLREWRIA